MLFAKNRSPAPIFCLLAGIFLLTYGALDLSRLKTLDDLKMERQAQVMQATYYAELDKSRSLTAEERKELTAEVDLFFQEQIDDTQKQAYKMLGVGGLLLVVFFAFVGWQARKSKSE